MSKAASIYAKSLFELALESNELEKMVEELEALTQALKQVPDAKEILVSAPLPLVAKKEVLSKALAGIEESMLYNFMMVLLDKGRMEDLDAIFLAYKKLVNEHLGIMEGTVASAVSLSEDQLTKLSAVFSRILNQKVKLNPTLDSTLIGGYRVNVGGKVYDNSLKFQLAQLQEDLMKIELK